MSGWILGGVIEPGMTLGDGTGAQTTVLTVEFESPEDRRTGQTTLLLARTTPSPVSARDGTGGRVEPGETGGVHVPRDLRDVEADPAGAERAVRGSDDRTAADGAVHPGSDVGVRPGDGATYLFDMEYQQQTRRISRTEAEQIARAELGTQLPTEPELQQMMRDGEAADS